MMKFFLCVMLAVSLVMTCAPATTQQPNIVLVITDDQGYGDLGCHGNDVIRTPRIDALYEESIRFDQFYVSPVCAPTRASLMTGRYNYRTGIIATNTGKANMEASEVTLAEIFGDAGYRTGIFGKWHLGDQWPMRPTDQGFQEALVHQGGGVGQASDPPEQTYFNPILQLNDEWVKTSGYCMDVYTDAAIEFIEDNRTNPFFVYLATNTPHVPLEVDEKYVTHYREAGLDNFTARIYAMCENIDENVGRLLDALDEQGLADNTIFIFMTDNGPQLFSRHGMELDCPRYSAGMRGAKSTPLENGIRVPFFVRWPAQMQGGRDIGRIAAHIDILPTLLDACGIDMPDGPKIDGVSIMPLLNSGAEAEAEWPDRTIYMQGNNDVPQLYHNFAARSQHYKLVQPVSYNQGMPDNAPLYLYDMEKDPGETTDLSAELPEIHARMKREYEDWFADVSSSRGYHAVRIPVGTPHQNPITLTQQVWRAPDSTRPGKPGAWLLDVVEAGEYTFTLQFPQTDAPATLWLKVGDREYTHEMDDQAMSCEFPSVNLPMGDVDVESFITVQGKKRTRTAYVHVSKK